MFEMQLDPIVKLNFVTSSAYIKTRDFVKTNGRSFINNVNRSGPR